MDVKTDGRWLVSVLLCIYFTYVCYDFADYNEESGVPVSAAAIFNCF